MLMLRLVLVLVLMLVLALMRVRPGEASEQESREGRVQSPQRPGLRSQDESKGEGRGA